METTPYTGQVPSAGTPAPGGFPPAGVFYPPGMEPPAPPEPEPAQPEASDDAQPDGAALTAAEPYVADAPAVQQHAYTTNGGAPSAAPPAPAYQPAEAPAPQQPYGDNAGTPTASLAPVETAPAPATPVEYAPAEHAPRHAAPDAPQSPAPEQQQAPVGVTAYWHDEQEAQQPAPYQPEPQQAEAEMAAQQQADAAAQQQAEAEAAAQQQAEAEAAAQQQAEAAQAEAAQASEQAEAVQAAERVAVIAGMALAEPEAPVDAPRLDPLLGLPHAENPMRPDVLEVEVLPEPVVPPPGHGRATTESQTEPDDFSLAEALGLMLDRGASDLHLTAGAKPTIRLSGSLVPLDDFPKITPQVLQRVLYAALTQSQREKFEENLELDFAYQLPGRARFRVNIYKQRDSVGAAFRVIPFELKTLEALGVPPVVANFAGLTRGFVLVTGPTGSGKSTTLAAVVDLANRTRHEHIMTVEDPIEFLHKHKSCIVNQREVGEDTWSFSNALKHVLRQDPDIILVGEMRDLETISVALTAAETGHLVFATLHTQDAAQTIDRVIDVFPPHQQQQVRAQLAMSLQGVVCQTLAKTADGRGRVVATEILVVTPAIRNLIREGKTHQIYSVMQAGAAHGMHTLDQHLAELVRTRKITYEVGLEKCHHMEDFNRLCGRA